jgi:hypothetical protein
MRRAGGRLKVPRKSHVKKDRQAAAEFRQGLSERLAEVIGRAVDQPVRIWVLDEHRYGLLLIIGHI